MAEPVSLQTGRGSYRLSLVDQAQAGEGPWTMTLSAEHAGGLEKFAFRCHIHPNLLERSSIADTDAACALLARWLEARFEEIRETALKSIRAERRLAQIEFDEAHPGPF
jgi:hypothetical protein